MKYNSLENRIVRFSSEVIKITYKVSKTIQGKHISNQIIRSASSISFNYGEAQAAESRKDFIHKIKIALKELRETHMGLKLLYELELYSSNELERLKEEAGELTAILITSIRTAQQNISKEEN